MSLFSWWKNNREQNRKLQDDLALNSDQTLIGEQVPELLGKAEVEGMAFVLEEIRKWRATASVEEGDELQRRMRGSSEALDVEGRIMPYWANLWLLRTYQQQLGLDVPWVAPKISD